MRYRLRYNVGPWFSRRPARGPGLLSGLLALVWTIVAFVLQLVVWVVLAVVGIVYTLLWLILRPFDRSYGRRPVRG